MYSSLHLRGCDCFQLLVRSCPTLSLRRLSSTKEETAMALRSPAPRKELQASSRILNVAILTYVTSLWLSNLRHSSLRLTWRLLWALRLRSTLRLPDDFLLYDLFSCASVSCFGCFPKRRVSMATVHTHTGQASVRLLLRRRLPLPGRPFQSQARRIELSCLPIRRSRRPRHSVYQPTCHHTASSLSRGAASASPVSSSSHVSSLDE